MRFFIAIVLWVMVRPLDLALADGCFVFKWDKKIDINEPTQKAIIVHDAGQEEMLLQVKYEGPLEEFGWLIPTPSLPTVEKGSMEPFYELSQLTQRRFGTSRGNGFKSMGESSGEPESVKVIETKTVGAYEVAVLSARDSGSLAKWLQEHDYSVPEEKRESVDEYVRRGWYFIAAKIDLSKGVDLKMAPRDGAKNPQSRLSSRKVIQSKLSSGELHPLLIRFDTPKPVFPLKISEVSGKPSEVSIYVIAKQPQVQRFVFGKGIEKLEREYSEWKEQASKRQQDRLNAMGHSRLLPLQFSLDSFYRTNPSSPYVDYHRDYTRGDLERIANENKAPERSYSLGETFYPARPEEMLSVMELNGENIPKSSKTFPQMKSGNWYVTKIAWMFSPSEMVDLEFEPAIGRLAETMARNIGGTAAQILARLGPEGENALRRAARSANPTERLNVAIGLERQSNKNFGEELAGLLKDDSPAVRLHALRVAEIAPNSRFTDTIMGLLRDPSREVREDAGSYLSNWETAQRTSVYLAMLNDSDPDIRATGLWIAAWINRIKGSHEVFVQARRSLKDPDERVRETALHVIYQLRDEEIPREEVLPFLSSREAAVSGMAIGILRRDAPFGQFEETGGLSSAETARLMTNGLTMSRLIGLKFLQHNRDAEAVELILPMLTDANTIVRNRAFVVLRRITNEDMPDEADKWQEWWRTNKAKFGAAASNQ